MASTAIETNKPKISKAAAIEMLWRKGNLQWMLDKSQLELYKIFHESSIKTHTWMLPRRFGKTRTLCIIAIEQCIRQPGSIVKFLSPTKKMVERNIRPLVREVLETCPEDLRPDLKKQDDIYYFSNGSEIQMAGSESGNIDNLRGGFSQICIVDEAQDVSELTYGINSVLLPTTLTTKGKIIIAGTPPKDPDHDFLRYVEDADNHNILVKRTVFDNPRLSKEDIDSQAEAMGGFDSEDFRREFLCQIIKSPTSSVIPEFTDEKEALIVKEWDRPAHYDAYISMDLGFKDWTVVLFGYYDFRFNKIVIQDELVTYGNEMHLPKLAQDIIDKMSLIWTNAFTNEVVKPRRLVSDHNLIAINEIKRASNYRLNFLPAEKKEGMAAGVNALRVHINANEIIVSPKCKTLIKHLRNAKWAASRTDFGRCPQGSHYDAVAALVYFVRAVDFRHNPFPNDHMGLPTKYLERVQNEGKHFTSSYYEKDVPKADVYKKILNLGKK
jgi:hypothetical protein